MVRYARLADVCCFVKTCSSPTVTKVSEFHSKSLKLLPRVPCDGNDSRCTSRRWYDCQIRSRERVDWATRKQISHCAVQEEAAQRLIGIDVWVAQTRNVTFLKQEMLLIGGSCIMRNGCWNRSARINRSHMCRDAEVLIASCKQASCAVLFLFVMCVLDKMAVTCDVADVSASCTPYVFNPLRHSGYQGWTNPGRRGAGATNFCTLAYGLCFVSPIWRLELRGG